MAECLAMPARIRGKTPTGTGYIRAGAGEPLLLIHGVGMNATIWAPQIDLLKNRYDVIAIDMLGHGDSPLPPENAVLADYADQAIALLDHLGLASASIAGHSMGALVAQEIALRSPQRVRRLISLNAVFRRPPELAKAVRERAAAMNSHGDPSAVDATISRWFGDPVPAELTAAAAKAREALESVDPQGYARTYRLFACSDEAHIDSLPQLSMPALFMTGSEDRNSSPAMSAAMAHLAPHGQCIVLEGERHMMTLASPEKVTRHIAAFLEANSPASSRAPEVFDPAEFRQALGSFLTGVAIVTTIGPDGEPRGFTANSFTSVSLDPPLVLVCIGRKAFGHPVFSASKSFAINILNENQKDASGVFASKATDKFASVSWRPGLTGSPTIDGALAVFDCDLDQLVDAGDHSILIGRVLHFSHSNAQPLGYWRGGYVDPGLSQEALAASPPDMAVGAILEDDGRVLFFEKEDGSYELPVGRGLGAREEPASLKGLFAARAIDADLGFLFAVWDGTAKPARTHVYYRGTLATPRSSDRRARLVDIEQIAALKIADPAVRSMLARYVREHMEDAFGVYVGSELAGEVRPLAKTSTSDSPMPGE